MSRWLGLLWGMLVGTSHAACLSGDVLVNRSMVLDPGCTHAATLWVVASQVVLDCRDGLIDARGRRYGVVIGGDRLVHSVTVRHCQVQGAFRGVHVGLLASDADKIARYDMDQLYEATPHDVRLESLTVQESEGVGIYIDDYAHHVTVAGSRVEGSGSAGIYLEHSSRHNQILGSLIIDNGYGHFPQVRLGASRREGIAIDSSAYNRVEGNYIAHNAGGGIFLYKNCHEYATSKPASVPRWQHASHNRILRNTLAAQPVGVWLASRQNRDLSAWDCGDMPRREGKYYWDYARFNTVQGNIFRDLEQGVRVEDDHNEILDNLFEETGETVVLSGPDRPVVGTIQRNNTIQ